jgi:hypothetical protein
VPRSAPLPEKSQAAISGEIQAIIRQITASVTFLPLLQDKCERFAVPCERVHHLATPDCLLTRRPSRRQAAAPVREPLDKSGCQACLPASMPASLPPQSELQGPLLCAAGTIDLLAYTDKENAVPLDWEESGPRHIANAADVKLRAFSTRVRAGVFGVVEVGGLALTQKQWSAWGGILSCASQVG